MELRVDYDAKMLYSMKRLDCFATCSIDPRQCPDPRRARCKTLRSRIIKFGWHPTLPLRRPRRPDGKGMVAAVATVAGGEIAAAAVIDAAAEMAR